MTTKKYIHSQSRNQPFEEIKHENYLLAELI